MQAQTAKKSISTVTVRFNGCSSTMSATLVSGDSKTAVVQIGSLEYYGFNNGKGVYVISR